MDIDEQIEVQVGFKAGKSIQFRHHPDRNYRDNDWRDSITPDWNFHAREYRIKPEAPKRWRAKEGEDYYYVSRKGSIVYDQDIQDAKPYTNYCLGNYFQTETEAKASAIHFILNDEYEYSFPWMENKPEVPAVHETWDIAYHKWVATGKVNGGIGIDRWPKHQKEES